MVLMRLRMWTYDLAREQVPTLDNLRSLLELTRSAGYNAFGLYMEHRFAYPSTPWAHGAGAVTPEMVRTLQADFPDIQIIPFLNLLGHMEGFIYTEYGRKFAEERFKGMQACPTNIETAELANSLIEDVLETFSAEIIHIGGDEAQQLGNCARCQEVGGGAPMRGPGDRPEDLTTARHHDSSHHKADKKARIYARYFAPLARKILDAGRRPAIWGDMLLEYPKAAVAMPRETLIFDWQYFESPEKSTRKLMNYGFEVVCCPSLQTYNAAWLHVEQSERNVKEHVRVANELNTYGVCVTTWENALFGSYEALMPAIQACGELLSAEPSEPQPSKEPQNRFALFGQISYLYHGELEGVQDWTSRDRPSEATTFANDLLSKAISDDAQMIKLEPTSRGLEVRYENGHKSVLAREFRAQVRDPLLNRMRLLAGLPVEGRKLAQRGFIAGRCAGVAFHFDVLTQPTEFGPRMTLTRKESAVASLPGIIEPAETILNSYGKLSSEHKEWARLMGVELQALGGVFAYSQIRSSLKVRLLLEGNPFLAWLHHREELSGETGAHALEICARAMQFARDPATRGVTGFVKSAVEFVRYAEQAHQAYANELPGVATATLAPARQIFDELEKIAKASHLRFGGSKADAERSRAAKQHVERVIHRIKEFGDGSLGYLPSFEHITHPNFIPHDQGAWWLINKWAYE